MFIQFMNAAKSHRVFLHKETGGTCTAVKPALPVCIA